MRLSEFVLTHVVGSRAIDLEYFADVSVTEESGALWWKKKTVTRRKIHREYAGFWHFVDNGQLTPGTQVEALEYSYKALETLAKQ